ncbi:MAG: carbamoyltransferase HypF [Blastocatellales bacterium]
MVTRAQILVRGIVQGVGFRPFIFSLASRRALRGQVFNSATGVIIDVEGESGAIAQLVDEIRLNAPPLSLIESVEFKDNLTPANFTDFRIIESNSDGEKFVPISADVATCEDCLKELFDPQNRRYRYPFINCTNCGPRFTIIEGVPYDRAQTTMSEFDMCEACRTEYENPLDRRFHAEPIACAACGPQLFLADCVGEKMEVANAIGFARQLLDEGSIVAIKGLGGFHLTCDATNAKAVERLRNKKFREDKPFALMAGSVEIIRKFCRVSKTEEDLLQSAVSPIVLLARKQKANLPAAIAPGVNTLGFMLPYTPLHYLLLDELDHPLVMTSGNVSDEPICYEDLDAAKRLNGIADFYLLHNRRIHMRTDDSVTRVFAGREMVLRRSRGYAPAPIKTSFKFKRQILACGAELKNTFCLARDNYAFVSHHMGDLEDLETLRSFTEGIEHYRRLFNLQPEIVAHDLHPEYLSTKHALEMDEIETKFGVQHHHAHIASCLADNSVEGEVIGVAMDGLGFGADGRLWGGEFFVADFLNAERIAHLDYIPMPGGTKSIRQPWRMAAVYLHCALGDEFLNLNLPFVHGLDQRAWTALRSMIIAQTNSPMTSSMGRLFDAMAALLGLRTAVNYEGQAAIELETIADRDDWPAYEFEINDEGIIKAEPVIQRAVEDLLNEVSPSAVSASFHLGVVNLITTIACRVRRERHLNRLALSGGVFQNMFLLERTCRALQSEGFEVFTHNRVPANDGGISLGQAAVANAHLASGRI